MTVWLRTRRIWSLVVAAVACAIGLNLLSARFVALPIVLGTDGIALWSTFLPLVWAVAVADCFASKVQSAEVRPSRRALLLDTTLLLVSAALAATLFSALAENQVTATGAAGHALIITGVACSATLRGGAGAGTLTACAALIATTFYGVDAPARPYVRLLQPDGDPRWALFVGITSCFVASSLILLEGAKIRLGATDA